MRDQALIGKRLSICREVVEFRRLAGLLRWTCVTRAGFALWLLYHSLVPLTL